MTELILRAKRHITQMAPHQRNREQGLLLQELVTALEQTHAEYIVYLHEYNHIKEQLKENKQRSDK